MRDQTQYNVRAVERALQILDCFDENHCEMGVSEIAEQVELHKATAHRILTTLLNFGYVERAADGQRYRLGLKLMEMGCKVMHNMDLREVALPYMTQLTQQFDEACDLSVFDRGQVLYIDVLKSSHALTIAASTGQRLPAYCTASGKVFLAHLGPDELSSHLSEPLKRFTSNTITSREKLLSELKDVKQQGCAYDNEELEVGIQAIAAPVYGRDGNVAAAIGMPCPTSRVGTDKLATFAKALIETTTAISRRLGWGS